MTFPYCIHASSLFSARLTPIDSHPGTAASTASSPALCVFASNNEQMLFVEILTCGQTTYGNICCGTDCLVSKSLICRAGFCCQIPSVFLKNKFRLHTFCSKNQSTLGAVGKITLSPEALSNVILQPFFVQFKNSPFCFNKR